MLTITIFIDHSSEMTS